MRKTKMENRIRKLIVLKEQYETKMQDMETEAKASYWKYNEHPIDEVLDSLEMLTEYKSQNAKLLAIDDFLFKNQKEYNLVRKKIRQEEQKLNEENEPFCKLDFSYTKDEFLDTLQSSMDSKEFEKIKPHISQFADYFMRQVDCSSIYVSIIGSMSILAEYFLENLDE